MKKIEIREYDWFADDGNGIFELVIKNGIALREIAEGEILESYGKILFNLKSGLKLFKIERR